MTRVIGIDPGSVTGLFCVSALRAWRCSTRPVAKRCDYDGPGGFMGHTCGATADPSTWRYVGRASIRASALKRPPTTGEARLFLEVRARLVEWTPALAVLEEPSDGMAKWSGGTGRGVAFGLGKAYGLVYAACVSAGVPIVTYNVTGRKARAASEGKKARPARDGWMPRVKTGNFEHVQPRDETLKQLRALAFEIMRRPMSGMMDVAEMTREITEHEVMSLGVLRYHLVERQGLASLAPR